MALLLERVLGGGDADGVLMPRFGCFCMCFQRAGREASLADLDLEAESFTEPGSPRCGLCASKASQALSEVCGFVLEGGPLPTDHCAPDALPPSLAAIYGGNSASEACVGMGSQAQRSLSLVVVGGSWGVISRPQSSEHTVLR